MLSLHNVSTRTGDTFSLVSSDSLVLLPLVSQEVVLLQLRVDLLLITKGTGDLVLEDLLLEAVSVDALALVVTEHHLLHCLAGSHLLHLDFLLLDGARASNSVSLVLGSLNDDLAMSSDDVLVV